MTEIRMTSECPDFPWHSARVCYFDLFQCRPVMLRYAGDLMYAVQRAIAGETTIYAVWPGQYRSDLFVIDDLSPLAARWKVEQR